MFIGVCGENYTITTPQDNLAFVRDLAFVHTKFIMLETIV